MKPSPLEANAAAVEIGQILQRVRHGKLVRIGKERRRAVAGARIVLLVEIGNDPVAREQVELEVRRLRRVSKACSFSTTPRESSGSA